MIKKYLLAADWFASNQIMEVQVIKVSVFLLAILLVLFSPMVEYEVSANGDSVEIFRERSGPYEIVLGVLPQQPTVGTIHLTITPIDAQTSDPIENSKITIVAYDPGGEPAYQVRALNTPNNPMYYDANLTISIPGIWTLKLFIESEVLGNITVNVPLTVERQAIPPSPWGTAIWLIVLVTIIGGALHLWYRSKSTEKSALI